MTAEKQAQITLVRAWLASARATDNPEGDLIADMRRASDLPACFPDIEAMRGYLRCKGACREALAVVPGVWRRYERWFDRNGARWSAA